MIHYFFGLIIYLLIIFTGNVLWQDGVVLGTKNIPRFFSLFIASIVSATVFFFVVPYVVKRIQVAVNTKVVKFFTALLVNTVIIWVVSRFGFFVGMGIEGFWVAMILSLPISILQTFSDSINFKFRPSLPQ